MLSPKFFVETLQTYSMDFFTGVPDSLLKNMCAYITDHIESQNNIIAVNEGTALGLAAGYYIATGCIPIVYMQNSGIGNTVNPLLSLTDKVVYNIPVLLLIGWRGEPGIKDEPQHIKQGMITIPLLDTLGIKNQILNKDPNMAKSQINDAIEYMRMTKEAFAFVIQKDTFEEYKLQNTEDSKFDLDREEAIKIVCNSLDKGSVIVSTTGMISRELFEYRESIDANHETDFLTVGSMGHASQIALGKALRRKNKKVYCFDGDGAVLMHMGALTTIGTSRAVNYIHIVFNNGAHDSVGGQPTVGLKVNLSKIASACGYNNVISVDSKATLKESLDRFKSINGPVLLEVKVRKGARKDLGRPTLTPVKNKELLMNFLEEADESDKSDNVFK